MPIASPETAVPDSPPADRVRRPSRRADAAVAGLAAAAALLVTAGLWRDPAGRAITVNSGDQALFEWLLAYGAHSLHGSNPLLTHLLNVPTGVNLAVNTSITAYAWLFAPLTALIGPPTTFAVILTLNLAGTAYAWYWLLSRHLGGTPLAAAVGGLFCGFAPEMVSHANAHLNWTAQWLVPLLIWRTIRLRDRRGGIVPGVVLGLLVAISFSIAAEALFFTALAIAVFLAAWALSPARRALARSLLPPFARGLAFAALTAGVLLSYPLYLHFLGPQTYHGTGFDPRIHAEDIAAFGAYPSRSLAGVAGLNTALAPNPTEENSFFGVPLLVLAIGCAVFLWRAGDAARRATLRALVITAALFAVLSWGPRVKWFGQITDIPLPYAALVHLPVFDAALPSRLALVVTPVIGLLLAFTLSALPPLAPRRRVLCGGAFALALLPLIPVPLFTTPREPIPRFITSGAWRNQVTPGGVLTPASFTSDLMPDGQRWQAHALANGQGEFALPAGFFLGPGGPDGRGRIGPVPRFMDSLLTYVARTGVRPVVTDVDRARAREDLRYWRVEAVVLPDRVHGAKWPVHVDALRETTTALLGRPERIDDVWLWRIRQ